MDYKRADEFARLLTSQRNFSGVGLKVYDLGIYDSLDSYAEAIKGLSGVSDEEFSRTALQRLGILMTDARSMPESVKGRLEASRGISKSERNGAIISAEFYCLGVQAFISANEVFSIPRDVETVRAVEKKYDIFTGKVKRGI